MPPTITATLNSSYHSPGVELVVGNLDDYDRIKVTRIDNSGEYPERGVRGLDDVPVSTTTVAESDYEAPLNKPIVYKVLAYVTGDPDPEEATSNEVMITADIGTVYLKSVLNPALSRRVNMASWPSRSRPGRILSDNAVLGRRNPVVLTDVLGGRRGSFSLGTYHVAGVPVNATHNDIETVLDQGTTLLLQTAGAQFTGEKDMYFEATDYNLSRESTIGGDLILIHAISFIETDPLDTLQESLGLRNYQSVYDQNMTYQEIYDEYTDYLDLLNRDR